jgi:tetratricopeptide (TPR) repeat protein
MALVIGNLGDVANRAGDLLESEDWFKRGLALAERINYRENVSWCSVELATVQQDLGNLHDAAINIQRGITIGRAIKSTRCIRHALVGLGELRILEAVIAYQIQHHGEEDHPHQHTSTYRRLLTRAKSTLQRAISLDGLEAETIIDGKFLLAKVHYLLHDLETAQHMAQETMAEAQTHETTRIIGRAQHLLGSIMADQGHIDQANEYFERALQIFHERQLRLDYARTMYTYGSILLQSTIPERKDKSRKVQFEDQSTRDKQYQKGVHYLQEARNIFVACQAAIDITLVEQLLVELEP